MSQTASTSTTRARLAHLMGLSNRHSDSSPKSPVSPDDDDEDYIPYNGPIEPPPRRGRPRGNTFGGPAVEPDDEQSSDRGRSRAWSFVSGSSQSHTNSNSNSNSHSHSNSHGQKSYLAGGIGEAPVHNVERDRSSVYSGRAVSTYSTGRRASVISADGEHRASIASFLTFGQASRKPNISVSVNANRHGSLTFTPISPFTNTTAEPTPAAFVFPTRGRRSEDRERGRTSLEGRGRRGREGIHAQVAQVTIDSHSNSTPTSAGTDPAPVSASTDLSSRDYAHVPRRQRDANTWYQEDLDAEDQSPSHRRLSHSASQPVLSSNTAPPAPVHNNTYRHPYALMQQTQPQQHVIKSPRSRTEISTQYDATRTQMPARPATAVPVSSINAAPASQPHPYSTVYQQPFVPSTASISPAAIAAALNNNSRRHLPDDNKRKLESPNSNLGVSRNSLRASTSTPNLRAFLGIGSGSKSDDKYMGNAPVEKRPSDAANVAAEKNILGRTKSTPGKKRGAANTKKNQPSPNKLQKQSKMQFAAETWCDALMFPRPRFRAHYVSPPPSPTDVALKEKERMLVVNVRPPSPLHQPLARSTTLPGHATPSSSFISPQYQTQNQLEAPLSYTDLTDPFLGPVPPSLTPQETLSPAEEALLRVVAEGERRDKEREQWNELARTSFQNRRSRSLSRTRTRKKSGAAAAELDRIPVRVRVESDVSQRKSSRAHDEKQGLTRSLTVGLTTLAAEAFRQPTPTISTPSASHHGHSAESGGHSRSTSESTRHGHLRNTSWGKAALKKLCAVEGDTLSEIEAVEKGKEKEEKLEGALMHQKTAKMRVRGRKEEAEEADVQFMDIAPIPKQNSPSKVNIRDTLEIANALDINRSHSQNSNASDSLDIPAVGIALSTPPPDPTPLDDDLPEFPDLSSHPYAAPRSRGPVSATYAGPHPTSHDYHLHRLSPYTHGFSENRKKQQNPENRMYAATQSGVIRQVSTPEITHTPVSATVAYAGPSAFAYASVAASDKRDSTLGVEEALMSRTFQRGLRLDREESERGSPLPGELVNAKVTASPPTKPIVPPLRKPTPMVAHSAIPGTPPAGLPDPQVARQIFRDRNDALPSPSSHTSSSSRMSPPPLGSMDDLESFRDLFYKPGRALAESHNRTSSIESKLLDTREASWAEERIRSSEGLSGLRNLSRQMSDNSQGSPGETHRLDGLQEERAEVRSPTLPGLNDGTLQINSPLRAEYGEGQDFPEDIQSSRASSLLEHEDVEETLRLGSVSLSVPVATEAERRQSTALSFGDTEDGSSMQPNRDTMFTTSSQGIPGNISDLLRASFVTSTSTTSHMSNIIGDFPIPPFAEMPHVRPDSSHFPSSSFSSVPTQREE